MNSRLILIACLLLVQTTLSLHLASKNIRWISSKGDKWTGYQPECKLLCVKAGGEVCDSYPVTCCQPSKCSQTFKISTCTASLPNFTCKNPVIKRGTVYNSPKFPELAFLNS